MLTTVRKLKRFLVGLLDATVAIVVAILVLDVLLQIIVRMLPDVECAWTEELATKLLIWLMLLGACVAFDHKSHLGVDYFVNKLPALGKRLLAMVVHGLTAFFAGVVLLYGGAQVVRQVLEKGQPLPALGIEMGYVYLALPISGIIILVIALENFLEVAASPQAPEAREDA